MHAALEADAARFGWEAEAAVAVYKDELGGKLPPWDVPHAVEEPPGWRIEDLRMAEHLAATCEREFGVLNTLLLRPRYLRPVTYAYGLIGARAVDEAPFVLAAWRRYLLAHLDPGEKAEERRPRIQGEPVRPLAWREEGSGRGRPARWFEMERRGPSAAAAFALVRLGNRSNDVMDGLWALLAHELHWYDRALVEVALQALRPRGDQVEEMIRVVRPGTKDVTPRVRASAREILPWSRDGDRTAARQVLRDLLERQGGPRLTRRNWIRLRGILQDIERLEQEPDKHVEALVERLRLYVFATQ